MALASSTSDSREMPSRCRHRCNDERVRCGMVACKAYRQSSSGTRVCLRKGDEDCLVCSSLNLILQTVPFWRWSVRYLMIFRQRSFFPSQWGRRQGRFASASCRSTSGLDGASPRCRTRFENAHGRLCFGSSCIRCTRGLSFRWPFMKHLRSPMVSFSAAR